MPYMLANTYIGTWLVVYGVLYSISYGYTTISKLGSYDRGRMAHEV